jgi:hypothetical protein
VSLERFSGANAAVRRNHFHDACGSGGRILIKTRNATIENNVAERFGEMIVSTEQEWLEGDLGLANVRLQNNAIIDPRDGQSRIKVMEGLPNITCINTTFAVGGNTTMRPDGCRASS